MKNNEWRNFIESWKNSEKYKNWQINMNQKKQDLKNLNLKLMSSQPESKENLLLLIEYLKDFEYIFDEEDVDVYQHQYFNIIGSEGDILQEYISRQVNWFSYLKRFLVLEDYEMCCEIRDAIEIECRQFNKLVIFYRNDILISNPEFLGFIDEVPTQLYLKLDDDS